VNRGGGAAPWTPASISGLKLWIDFSDADTLFTDAGSTKVTADGDAIYQANDKSGNGHHAVQATVDKRPSHKVNVLNSLSVALFDGIDFMKCAGLQLSTTVTGIFAIRNITLSAFAMIVSNRTSDTPIQYQIYLKNGYPGTFLRDNLGHNLAAEMGAPYQYDNTNVLVGCVRDTTSAYIYANGVLRKSGSNIDITGVTATDTYIGAVYNGASTFAGYMYELIAYDRVLADVERELVETYLNDKWNIYEPARTESLEGLLSFEPEEETLWWQGESVLDRAQPQVTLSWWERANQTVDNAIEKAAKYISDKWNKLLQAIKDYFSYDEEE
jgi:hypothetical protein